MLKHPFSISQAPTGLERIQLRLQKNQQYLKLIQQQLPKQLAEHCHHVVFNNSKLLLYTDSPVWASKLLFNRVKIIGAFTSHFREPVHGLTVRVVDNSHFAVKNRRVKPSKNKTHTILELAVSQLANIINKKS